MRVSRICLARAGWLRSEVTVVEKFLNFANLKSFLVAVPAIHAFCCLIYLMFYDLRFGFRIWQFTGPGDIFSMSLGVVIPFYLSTAVGILSGIWMASPIKIIRTDKDRMEIGPNNINFWIKNSHITAFFAVAIFSIIYLMTNDIIISIYKSIFRIEIILYPCLVALIFFDIFFISKHIESKPLKHLVFYSIFGIFGVAFNAMMVAQKDATTPYSELSQESPKCGKYSLVMPHGDSFVAVRSDNARVIISKKCDSEILLFDSSKFVPVTNATAREAVDYYAKKFGLWWSGMVAKLRR